MIDVRIFCVVLFRLVARHNLIISRIEQTR